MKPFWASQSQVDLTLEGLHIFSPMKDQETPARQPWSESQVCAPNWRRTNLLWRDTDVGHITAVCWPVLNGHGQPLACDAWKWWRKGGVQGGISKTCTNLPIEFEMETNEDHMKLGKEARMIFAGVSCEKMHAYKSYACFKIRWPLKFPKFVQMFLCKRHLSFWTRTHDVLQLYKIPYHWRFDEYEF